MPELSSFDYAIIRVVPRVDREEFVNAGVVLLCLEKRFLAARIVFDSTRALQLWPQADLQSIESHLHAFPRICQGAPASGPIAQLSQRERFHWLVGPRSSVIQVGPVHSGLCQSPETALDNLMQRLVLL